MDTPTFGLPSNETLDALEVALDRWKRGVATMKEYDEAVAQSRDLYAELVDVSPSHVAVANQVSVFVGVIASSLAPGSKVLLAEGEFTSVLFPFLVNEKRGIEVTTVPLQDIATAIDSATDLVAFSLVQSSDGRIADVDAIEESARFHSARILVDTTQAAGWMPVQAGRFDYTVASAYKWLLSPRGTAFMTLGDTTDESVRPLLAGWYAGEEPWKSIYGGPLRLASDARRYDVSPAWLAWIGTVPALEMIAGLGVESIQRHNLELARRIERHLGLEESGSTIVTVPMTDSSRLAELGIHTAVRSNAVRVGVHFYNNADDVDAFLAAVEDLDQSG